MKLSTFIAILTELQNIGNENIVIFNTQEGEMYEVDLVEVKGVEHTIGICVKEEN